MKAGCVGDKQCKASLLSSTEMYWEWLEGSTDRIEEFYYLP